MKRRLFYLLIVLQIIFLFGMAGSSWATGAMGQEIQMRTIPVDPRDYLYGDYVILNYKMSRVAPSLWQGKGGLPESGDTVYTLLRPNPTDELYEPVGVYPERVNTAANEVLLKGIVEYSWENDVIAIRYGLERYYVPEGTGKSLEEQNDNLIVTVKVAPWGQTQITDVEIAD